MKTDKTNETNKKRERTGRNGQSERILHLNGMSQSMTSFADQKVKYIIPFKCAGGVTLFKSKVF